MVLRKAASRGRKINEGSDGMSVVRTRTLLLLCSFALFAAPGVGASASAKPVRPAKAAFLDHNSQLQPTDVSARRKRARNTFVRADLTPAQAQMHAPDGYNPAQASAPRRGRGMSAAARTPLQPWSSSPEISSVRHATYTPGYEYAPQPRGRAARTASLRPHAATDDYASLPRGGGISTVGGGSLVSEARRWIGGNPTGRASLWCGHFMNFVLKRTGYRESPSNQARSFASYGRRISGPQVGAIAVMSRGANGGHVGVVSGIDPSGNPIIISGNHNRIVDEAVYPRGRIYAYVMP
jgi:uncharacterized protein (TIGR02594 family)